jgi:hypothetical protein
VPEIQKLLLLFHRSTPVQAMSAISRLFSALGWNSPPEADSCWGERPPQKLIDRRLSVRSFGFGEATYLGWWAGEEFRSVEGQLRDISLGGAQILTWEVPLSKHVWIGPFEPGETCWCLMRVVRVREVWFGLIEIGLAFEGSCDSDLFEGVTT